MGSQDFSSCSNHCMYWRNLALETSKEQQADRVRVGYSIGPIYRSTAAEPVVMPLPSSDEWIQVRRSRNFLSAVTPNTLRNWACLCSLPRRANFVCRHAVLKPSHDNPVPAVYILVCTSIFCSGCSDHGRRTGKVPTCPHFLDVYWLQTNKPCIGHARTISPSPA